MVRLGIPEDKPVAVQQWQGLIAINYPGTLAVLTLRETFNVEPHSSRFRHVRGSQQTTVS